MPRPNSVTHDPYAIHCAHPGCNAGVDEPCRTPDGEGRHSAHAWRLQTSFGLTHDGPCAGRAAADAYRAIFPDVDATAIYCAPTRSQYRWRSRWSDIWKQWWKDEDAAAAAYESEQDCGCLPLSNEALPAATVLEQAALGPGSPQENLTDAIAQAQQQENVRRRR